MGETHVWKTLVGAVRFITNIYSWVTQTWESAGKLQSFRKALSLISFGIHALEAFIERQGQLNTVNRKLNS